MPREWTGSVFQLDGQGTFRAKWKEFGTERWQTTKGFATRSEASDFLAQKRRDYRMKRRGEWDEFAEHRRRLIGEHVEEFHAHVLGNRRRREGPRTERHANQSRQRLRDAFAAMKVRTIADLTASRVDRFLSKLLDDDQRRVKTRNDYAAVLRQFSKWAAADQRVERDPLGNVRFVDDVAGPAKKQTLPWARVRDLAAACVQRQVQRVPGVVLETYLEIGRRRALTVTTMFLTGLRNNELANLRWDWIDFGQRLITVPHQHTKTARTEFIPLHAGLGELLQAERRRRAVATGQPVAGSEFVIGALPHHINDRLRADWKFIGGPEVDERGHVFSLYSMRTSFGTELDALGVPAPVVSALLRHRPSDITQQHYVHRSLALMLQAIDTIPAEAARIPGLYGDPRPDPNQADIGRHEPAVTRRAK